MCRRSQGADSGEVLVPGKKSPLMGHHEDEQQEMIMSSILIKGVDGLNEPKGCVVLSNFAQ